jgi:putative endonuclease
MYFVYVLWSAEDQKFYIGYTTDLERRFKEHYNGQCHTTIRMADPRPIFYEGFSSKEDAKRREGYFKTTKGKKALRLMLRESMRE